LEPPSSEFIHFTPFTTSDWLCLVAATVVLLLSGLLRCCETAFLSLTATEIEKLKKQDSRAAYRLSELIQRPRRLSSGISTCSNFANISVVFLSNSLISSSIHFASEASRFVIQILLVVIVILLVCEIAPRLLALRRPEQIVLKLSALIKAACKISAAFRLTSSDLHEGAKEEMSMGELSDAIEITAGKSHENRKILKAILEAVDTEVVEILRPRIDVTAIDISSDFKTLCNTVVDCGYSRIPVYDSNFDNIKGILYVKDLLPYIGIADRDFNWQKLVHEAYFVPENKRINDLLDEFQRKKIHMAVVVDEYGGTTGIITLEDILEEMVGDIMDESDVEAEERLFIKMKDGSYSFEGKTPLNDFYRIMDTDNELFDKVKGDAETLAGLILEFKGDFPEQGEELSIKQFRFKIEQIDLRRIKKIRVSPRI
jgi:gliding motility-associated protein GldE